MSLSATELSQLRAALQDAVVKCSERCLYSSSKWFAPHFRPCWQDGQPTNFTWTGLPNSLTRCQRRTMPPTPRPKVMHNLLPPYTPRTKIQKKLRSRRKNLTATCSRNRCSTAKSSTAALLSSSPTRSSQASSVPSPIIPQQHRLQLARREQGRLLVQEGGNRARRCLSPGSARRASS
jgi:hypothetical protein